MDEMTVNEMDQNEVVVTEAGETNKSLFSGENLVKGTLVLGGGTLIVKTVSYIFDKVTTNAEEKMRISKAKAAAAKAEKEKIEKEKEQEKHKDDIPTSEEGEKILKEAEQ